MHDIHPEEARIRALHDEFEAAIKTKDLDRIMAQYAPDVVAFDAIGALQFVGVPDYHAHWQRCFEFCEGEGFFETHDLHVEVGGDLAYSRMLSHCGGPNKEGQMQTCWMRGSRVWGKRDGQWRVVHEHFSMPFDMETGRVGMSHGPTPLQEQAG
ncbi:YybH family protein [Stutzerimonas stutzeri]|uniref:YybH family protein n=1 Tax=Stutzerimonas stutzeri TaxID=316 RepID=UPI003711B32F